MEEVDDVLNFLVGDDPADEDDVGPLVVELIRDKAIWLPLEMREVRHDRKKCGPAESELFKVQPIELRVTEREVAAIRVRAQFAAAAKTLPGERSVHVDEVFGRRDVVIDERHPIRKGEGGARCFRAKREMVKQQSLGVAEVHQFAAIAGQRLERYVDSFDEEVGLMAVTPQPALNAENFVANRIAVPERSQDLMDPDHLR